MQLAEMGFPLEACRKAVYFTGNTGAEVAFNWIIVHMEEPGKCSCGERCGVPEGDLSDGWAKSRLSLLLSRGFLGITSSFKVYAGC